ncbi:MAG: NAD(P)/FAD-dependent oxidoreductase [Bacteroidota bacterium]
MKRDVIVVGAGPGGATAAAMLARRGVNVLLLDKQRFPRDKVCGDAISGKSVDALKALGVIDKMPLARPLDTWGITFSSPAGDQVTIPFTKDFTQPIPPGYVCPRLTFDRVTFEAAVDSGAEVWQEATVKNLIMDGQRVTGVTVQRKGEKEAHTIHAPIVIGADGAYSVVVRDLGMTQLDEKHYAGSMRAYYEGVTGFDEMNSIELHFADVVIPGYFWIFPLPDGRANVGLGMVSHLMKKHNVKLRPLLDQLVTHPRFRDRFANAERIGSMKGWGLPLGSKPRPMAGDGWMLVGDAASLIDPFTGEGIGNAMISAIHAAEWAERALETGATSAADLKGYGDAVMADLRQELKISTMLLRLAQWPTLLNFLIRKASRSTEVADTISCMFDDMSERRRLLSPMFYLRLLAA